MNYNLLKTCKVCKNIDSFELTKVQAAFELYDQNKIWNTECSKCKSSKTESLSLNKPDIDEELLEIWTNNESYYFMQQDEELIIAEISNYHQILKLIDSNEINLSKVEILINSLCVLLYDNAVNDFEYSQEENKTRKEILVEILPELKKRKELLLKFESNIPNYIKDEIFPIIFLK